MRSAGELGSSSRGSGSVFPARIAPLLPTCSPSCPAAGVRCTNRARGASCGAGRGCRGRPGGWGETARKCANRAVGRGFQHRRPQARMRRACNRESASCGRRAAARALGLSVERGHQSRWPGAWGRARAAGTGGGAAPACPGRPASRRPLRSCAFRHGMEPSDEGVTPNREAMSPACQLGAAPTHANPLPLELRGGRLPSSQRGFVRSQRREAMEGALTRAATDGALRGEGCRSHDECHGRNGLGAPHAQSQSWTGGDSGMQPVVRPPALTRASTR